MTLEEALAAIRAAENRTQARDICNDMAMDVQRGLRPNAEADACRQELQRIWGDPPQFSRTITPPWTGYWGD